MDSQVIFDPEYCCCCGERNDNDPMRCFICHGLQFNGLVLEQIAKDSNFVYVCDICDAAITDDESLIPIDKMNELLAEDELPNCE